MSYGAEDHKRLETAPEAAILKVFESMREQMKSIHSRILISVALFFLFSANLSGQVPNPVPFISQPLIPTSVAPGSGAFTIIVNGTGFVPSALAPGSVVKWNGSPRTTTFINSSRLEADILAGDVATVGTASITVVSPTPGGGTSNVAFFHVTDPTTSIAMSSTDYATDLSASSVATGDFNGDGQLDLAVANDIINGTVSILLGNADGTFQSQPTFPVGSQPAWVTTADFNADGKLDLAVANRSDGTVTILMGAGDGTFPSSADMATGSNPRSVATADFNADGKLDLAIANGIDDTVSILQGIGDGSFQAQTTFATGTNAASVTTADLNADGKLDLAVGNQGSATVSILQGNGDGTFQANVDFATGNSPRSVTTADFNADGKLDLAVANGFDDTVSILLGNGDGTFAPQTSFATGGSPRSLTTGDFNGDDMLDLAVPNGDAVSMLLGIGDGRFQAKVDVGPTGLAPGSVTTGDFNGDGRLDLADANEGLPTVIVLLQTAAAPAVQLSTTSLPFGVQLVGTTSAPMQVTLANNGTAALNLSTINTQVAIGNTAASPDFASGWDSASICFTSNVLPAGQSCVRNVTFTPSVPGLRTAVIAFNTDAPTSPDYVSLSGSGLSLGVITPSVPSLDFGSRPVGTITTFQFRITNTGAGSMNIQGMTFTGNFALDAGNTTCPTIGPLAASASCDIGVTFSAYTLGINNGQLVITNDGAGNPFSLPLIGTATAVPFANGEVFASGSLGQVRRFAATGQLIQIMQTAFSGDTTGMAFDAAGNLYVTNFLNSNVSRFDGNGALLGTFGSGYNGHPESIVFDAQGNAYVGAVDGDNDIRKFTANGTPLAQFNVATETRGSDWIELGPDQCTMYYTSEGTAVKRFDVCTNTQLTDFATGIGDLSTKFTLALRLRPNGEMLVANYANIVRLNSSGNIIQTYDATGINGWFALNLDPDGTSFWSSDISGNAVVKFDIATGNELLRFDPDMTFTEGLALKGEIQVATSPAVSLSTASVNFPGNPLGVPCPTKPVTVTNTGNSDLVISSIVADSPFSVVSTTCPVGAGALPADQSCVVNLKFTPLVVGTVTNKLLKIFTNAPGSPQTVVLSGTGTPACALLAKVRVVTVLRGTDLQDFAIEDAKPSCSPVELNLTCSVENPAACLLTPAVIAPSGASTLRVTNLKRVGAESLVVEVTSTSEFRQATERVSVRFADFAMTRSPEEAAVAAGGSTSYALAVRPVNGLAGPVTFTCSGAPRGATCAVEPANITLDGASVAQVKVKVVTSGGAALPPVNLPDDGARRTLPLLLGLLALMMVGATRRLTTVAAIYDRRAVERSSTLQQLVLATMMLLLLLWASCGGGGGMNLAGGGTPAGRYALTVTGTYSSSTGPTPGTLSNSTTLNLKVN